MYIYICVCVCVDIGMIVRVFANGPGDLGSIPSWVIPKTQKMVLDASLLNTQHYKVWIKGKVEQSRERSSAFPYTLVLLQSKMDPSGHPQLQLLYECVCVDVYICLCVYIYIYIRKILDNTTILYSSKSKKKIPNIRSHSYKKKKSDSPHLTKFLLI